MIITINKDIHIEGDAILDDEGLWVNGVCIAPYSGQRITVTGTLTVKTTIKHATKNKR